MGLRRTTSATLVAASLAWGAFVGVPARAEAQGARRIAQADTSTRAALIAERQRVRAELERANADVDALKRSSRGLRQDYHLRERLADAEALARRLTELDARLGGAAPPAAASAVTAEPHVAATDGPAELEAKADILADQAQRLEARGDALLGRARDLRARQTLRRRVGQMERDPFSPLEGSKRRTMAGATVTGSSISSGGGANSGPPRGSTGTGADKGVGGAGQGPVAVDQSGGSGTLTTPSTVSNPGAANLPPSTSVPTGTTSSAAHAATPSTAPTPTSASDGTALSAQLRDLLDPATLAQLRQLEAAGGPGASFEALEHAGAALKARADRLRQQAASLRAPSRGR